MFKEWSKDRPTIFPTHAEVMEREKDKLKFPDVHKMIFNNARAIAGNLKGKNIPAADLTNEQKCALFTLAGYMEYKNGKLMTIRPVSIADDGNGRYILGIAPAESHANNAFPDSP